jgi:hypothetical protein
MCIRWNSAGQLIQTGRNFGDVVGYQYCEKFSVCSGVTVKTLKAQLYRTEIFQLVRFTLYPSGVVFTFKGVVYEQHIFFNRERLKY